MLREEKIARRFSEKRKLTPPVDPEKLVKEFAYLEEDSLPEGYDAVYLDKSAKRPKPQVIIKSGLSKARRTFTLGHELGHIIIPWHIGTHFCRVDAEAQLLDHLVKKAESEANRFAAELLMPAAWVTNLFKSTKSVKELINAVKEANVSYQAASIRLLQTLPEGYVFIETDPNGLILRAQGTTGTKILLPAQNSILNEINLNKLSEDFAKFRLGSSVIFWWRLTKKLEAPKTNSVDKKASDLLMQIIDEVFEDKTANSKRPIMQINGVIGAANGSFKTHQEKGDLFTILKQRFAYRKDLEKIVAHSSFDIFLQKRIEEITLRD